MTMIVFVKEISFDGFHGVYEEERRDGRHFEVDLEAEVSDLSSTDSDDLEETLDYRRLAEIVEEVARGESRFLVEKLAGEILDKLFDRHKSVVAATIEVRKQAPDVIASPRWVGVRLHRRREE